MVDPPLPHSHPPPFTPSFSRHPGRILWSTPRLVHIVTVLDLRSTAYLISSLTSLFSPMQSLSTAQCKLQEAVWEAITRELSYLRVVKTLTYVCMILERALSSLRSQLIFMFLGVVSASLGGSPTRPVFV